MDLVINDATFIDVGAVVPDLDFAVAQVFGSFKANVHQGEVVVPFDETVGFQKEEFIVGLVGREEVDAGEVHAEAVNV